MVLLQEDPVLPHQVIVLRLVPHHLDMALHPEDLVLHPQVMVLHLVDQVHLMAPNQEVHKAVRKLQDKTVKVFQFRFPELNKEGDRDLFVKYLEMEVEVVEEEVEVEEDHLIMVEDELGSDICSFIYIYVFIKTTLHLKKNTIVLLRHNFFGNGVNS